MNRFSADIGTWEKGKHVQLEADNREYALIEAYNLVDDQTDNYVVQLYENNHVIWDYYCLPGQWRR